MADRLPGKDLDTLKRALGRVQVTLFPHHFLYKKGTGTVGQKNTTMGPTGPATKNDCPGEDQQKFTRNRQKWNVTSTWRKSQSIFCRF
jgi:hypothetical protein